MKTSTIRYSGSGDIGARIPPTQDYAFYVIPALRGARLACLENRLEAVGWGAQFSVSDYGGVATGIQVQRQGEQQPLPLPSRVLSEIAGCVGNFVLAQRPVAEAA